MGKRTLGWAGRGERIIFRQIVEHFFYTACITLARGIFGLLGPTRILYPEHASREGGWLLASNHISHFDPPLLESTAGRDLHFMAMKELFENPVSAAFFRATLAFPTDRSKVDRAAVREALVRLKAGKVVGIFPEGGIRAGAESVLESGVVRPGVSALAQMAGVPIVPAVVLGSDSLYRWQSWLPFRRTRFAVAYGKPLSIRADLGGKEAREQLERDLIDALKCLHAELLHAYPEFSCKTP